MSHHRNPAAGYMPQMDGLRAIAVISVLVQHWFAPAIPIGSWGVILFFVISGFLISRSLFTLRDGGVTLIAAAKRFFYRRALRIWPAYYLAIAIGFLLIPEARTWWFWYAGFASNVLVASAERIVPLTPTWSLAVEEQFYLFWFFIILTVSAKSLRMLLVSLIAGAILFRCVVFAVGAPLAVALLPACVDALALGSLLCIAEREQWNMSSCSGQAAILLLAMAVVLTKMRSPIPWIEDALCPAIVGLAATITVWRARKGFSGWFGVVLAWPPIVYLGRISYGIYLYHMVTPELVKFMPFLRQFGFGGHLVLTIALAALSFHLMERPLLAGRRFGRSVPVELSPIG
jgi:peptidoglycan/LPS O-acetylase OafA/YrhL